jgi:hypothetical protein
MNEYLLNILNNIKSQNLSPEHALDALVMFINNLAIQTFNTDDYVLLPNKKDFKSKDGSLKKPTIFMNGGGVYYLAPKNDLFIEENI